MITSNRLRLLRKFVILGLLLAGFAAVDSVPGEGTKASAAICCSACDADPIPPPCFTHNCNPDC